MRRRLPPDRHGGPDRATFDLVAPLALEATDMHTRDSSGAVSPLIGDRNIGGLRRGDVESANQRSTPRTPTMPGVRTSATATRTTTTSRMTTVRAPSADHSGAEIRHADFSFKVASKHCTLCRRYLPFTDFYRQGLTGRHAYCKLCHWDRTRELRAIKRDRMQAVMHG